MAEHELGQGSGGTGGGQPVDEALRAYLAGRDALCPSCGYNLRGVESRACPECGSGLELSLSRPGPAGGWVAFALLAFLWLLLAGGMNTTRNAVRLADQKRQMEQTRSWSRSFTIQMGPMTAPQLPRLVLPGPPGGGGAGGAGGGSGGSGDPMQDMMDQMERDMQRQMQQLQQQMQRPLQNSPQFPTLRFQSRPPAAAPKVTWLAAWEAQGVQQQIAGVWGAVVLVGGLAGLILLALLGRRPVAVRRLSAMAAGLFVVYAGWHIVLFAREMMGL